MVDVAYPESGADAMMRVEETSFWFRHRSEVVSHALDRFAPGAKVWDVGGGNGFQAKKLQEQGREVVVVEPGEAGCRNARRRGVREVVQGTLEAQALPEASVQAMTLLDVVEHLPRPEVTLRECARVLAPGGRVVVTVPAYQLLWSDEDDYAEHQRRYRRALLDEHLASAGLRVTWCTYFFTALVVPILLLRALPYRLGRRRPNETDLGEHEPGGVSQRAVEALLRAELRALRAGRMLPAGSSILAVASR